MKNKFSLLGCVLMIAAALALLPLTAQATSYTWTGTNSNAWGTTGNWSVAGFPNAYTDQATITTTGINKPVILTGTELLGIASGTALTTNSTSAITPLDIQGTLGIQGNIVNTRSSGTGTEKITVEGILRNDAASNATTYSITGANGSISLVGGTISSQNGGLWSFGQAINGYGTISSPFTNTSTISANVSGQTLHITGSSTAGGSFASSVAGAILSLESAITGVNLSGHTGEVDLNGATITGLTVANSGTGAINLTGNSTLAGTFTRNSNTPITFNGHTLHMSGVTVANVSGGVASFAIGTGTMDLGTTLSSISNGDPITMAGGSIIAGSGGSLTNAGQIIGYGTISAPISGTGNVRASGGKMSVSGPLTITGTTILTNGVAGDILDLQGTVTANNSAWIYSNPSGNPGNGEVRFDGANISGPTGLGQTLTLGQGAVNVTAGSTISGNITSNAALTVNNGMNLNASGATFTNSNLGVVYVTGGATATWGNFTNNGVYKSDPSTQTFTNLTVGTGGTIQAQSGDVYQIKGDFINNSTQNASWNTTAATLAFLSNGTTTTHNVALAGADLGQNLAGYTNNFAWGTLDLTSQTLTLTDGNATPGAALYLGKITGETIVAGMVTDITGNGFNIYYDPSLNPDLLGLTYGLGSGGSLEPFSASAVPVPPSLLLLGSGLLGLAGLGWRRKKFSQA